MVAATAASQEDTGGEHGGCCDGRKQAKEKVEGIDRWTRRLVGELVGFYYNICVLSEARGADERAVCLL